MSRKNLTVEDQLLNLYIGKVPPIVFFAMALLSYTHAQGCPEYGRDGWIEIQPRNCVHFASKLLN